jgi:hypothetical protein
MLPILGIERVRARQVKTEVGSHSTKPAPQCHYHTSPASPARALIQGDSPEVKLFPCEIHSGSSALSFINICVTVGHLFCFGRNWAIGLDSIALVRSFDQGAKRKEMFWVLLKFTITKRLHFHIVGKLGLEKFDFFWIMF